MKTALALAAIVGFAIFSVLVKNELRADRSPIAALQIGQPMPDFTLTDLSGAEVSLSRVVKENKLVVINFWASWCGPCRLEMPGFEKLYKAKQKEGFAILGVNVDSKRDDMTDYLSRKPVTFPILIDTGSALMQRLGVRVLPTTILVGADGRIKMVTEGIHEYLSAFVEMELSGAVFGVAK